MPGPGTGEWDGGWSMFTSLLPAEHIPTTQSWRLFNLQILKKQQERLLSTDLIIFYVTLQNKASEMMLRSSAEAKI